MVDVVERRRRFGYVFFGHADDDAMFAEGTLDVHVWRYSQHGMLACLKRNNDGDVTFSAWLDEYKLPFGTASMHVFKYA